MSRGRLLRHHGRRQGRPEDGGRVMDQRPRAAYPVDQAQRLVLATLNLGACEPDELARRLRLWPYLAAHTGAGALPLTGRGHMVNALTVLARMGLVECTGHAWKVTASGRALANTLIEVPQDKERQGGVS
jgi:hypothetical protein